MPAAPKHPCSTPGCPQYQPCPTHIRAKHPDTKTNEERKLYSSYRWRQVSKRHLEDEPLCRTHLAQGRYVRATVTDHIVAYRDGGGFWDPDNHQSQCDPCHNAKRSKERAARYGGG